MQAVTTIGLDIAKSVFQVHGIDATGQVVIRRQLKRRYVLGFFQIKAIRAHLAEFGIIARIGRNGVEELLNVVADASDRRLPEVAHACLLALGVQLCMLKAQILEFDRQIMAWHRANDLNWFNKHTQGTARSAPMAVGYRRMWQKIADRYAKDMLSPFFRYLTAPACCRQTPMMTTSPVISGIGKRRVFGRSRSISCGSSCATRGEGNILRIRSN